jgi:hypothetical protein
VEREAQRCRVEQNGASPAKSPAKRNTKAK